MDVSHEYVYMCKSLQYVPLSGIASNFICFPKLPNTIWKVLKYFTTPSHGFIVQGILFSSNQRKLSFTCYQLSSRLCWRWNLGWWWMRFPVWSLPGLNNFKLTPRCTRFCFPISLSVIRSHHTFHSGNGFYTVRVRNTSQGCNLCWTVNHICGI